MGTSAIRTFLLLLLAVLPYSAIAMTMQRSITAHGPSGTSATLTYSVKTSYGTGPIEKGPVLDGGDITMRVAGRTVGMLSLSSLGIIDQYHMFFRNLRYSCGAGAPISFAGGDPEYLVIESVEVGKGCRPQVALIEPRTLTIVPELSVDHQYQHRFDPVPMPFKPKLAVRVIASQCFNVPNQPKVLNEPELSRAPWRVCVIHTITASAKHKDFFAEYPLTIDLPDANERITIGSVAGNLAFRLSAKHETRWFSTKKPLSPKALRSMLYGEYLTRYQILGQRGDFEGSLTAYKKALRYYPLSHSSDATEIARFQRILNDYRHGRITLARAKALWLGY